MGAVLKEMTPATAPTATMFLARSEPPISLASFSIRTGRARSRYSSGISTAVSSKRITPSGPRESQCSSQASWLKQTSRSTALPWL